MADKTYTDGFSTDCPDLQAFIKSLDLLDDKINNAVREAMHSAADIIVNEQRRLVSDHPSLVPFITKLPLRVSKKNKVYINCGYQANTFDSAEYGKNMGEYGMAVEFGRPGRGKRNYPTMTQIRYGKKVSVNKGTIQPQSHIIRGFENKVNEASNTVIEAVNRVLDEAEK